MGEIWGLKNQFPSWNSIYPLIFQKNYFHILQYWYWWIDKFVLAKIHNNLGLSYNFWTFQRVKWVKFWSQKCQFLSWISKYPLISQKIYVQILQCWYWWINKFVWAKYTTIWVFWITFESSKGWNKWKLGGQKSKFSSWNSKYYLISTNIYMYQFCPI